MAQNSLQLSGPDRWVVLAARQTIDEASELARLYGRDVDGLRVVRASNGWFAVVLGPMPVATIAAAQSRLGKRLWLPSDAYLTRGDKFVETVYTAPPSPVRGYAAYEGKAPVTVTWGELQLTLDSAGPKNGRVPTLTGRSGGRPVFTTRLSEAAREQPNGELRIVRLDPRTPTPQVVVSSHWGGAHCCTVTHVATQLSTGQWHVVEAETLDGSGYGFEDIDGDGAAELVSVDNSFLYAFESNAGSFAPTRLHKLEGMTLREVSAEPAMRSFMRSNLARMERSAREDASLWRSNGFLAGWVAAKARVGEVDEAWSRMLEHYDRNPAFPTTECLLPLSLDKCPADKQRVVPFPEALRTHLVKNGYPVPVSGSIEVTPRPQAPSAAAAASVPASYQEAEATFLRLAETARYDLQMLMIAAGHWPAVSTDTFSRRLYEAIQKAQAESGLPVTGWPDPAFFQAMRNAASPLLARWRLAPVALPAAGGLRLWVPQGMNLIQKPSHNGIEFTTSPPVLRINYSFYPGLPVKAAYDAALAVMQPPVVVQYKVQRPDFFAIASSRGEVGSYARYHVVRGGLIGFTMDWADLDHLRGDRLSTLMSDLFRAEAGLGLDRRPPVPAPGAMASARPAPPTSPAPASPTPGETRGRRSTGTAFFVTTEGHAFTNNHVVDGCSALTVSLGKDGPRPARIVARDATNDLAVIKIEARPESVAALRPTIRLGDTVAVFGFPLTGLLTTSGNFTLGNVTALAGIRDDSRMLQISAPVQPGNSGGPLLDETGAVVGVVVAKLNALKLAAATDDLAQNVNFAIKGAVAQAFAESQGLKLSAAPVDATPLKPADLAERAKAFTGLVDCTK